MPLHRPPRLLAAVASVALLASACGDDDGGNGNGGGEIIVFAAASLTDVFEEIGIAFEAANDGATVTFSFAGSSDLADQISEGAPADVFASANPENMEKVAAATAGEPRDFASNRLAIAVEPDNPTAITGLADLADPDRVVVLCDMEVPCGSFAEQILDGARVDVSPDSYELDVRAVLTKVEIGEADAGIVYVTDIAAAGDDVDQVDIPTDQNAVARYPIATLEESSDGDLAGRFVDFLVGDEGQALLAEYGFGEP